MTLPSNIIFPLHDRYLQNKNPEDLQAYMLELTYTLQRMYEDISQAVNGDLKSDFQTQRKQWIPVLDGTGTSGTFTYTNQYGVVLRQGLMVDVWFDVTWSSTGSAAGNLFLELPYEVSLANGKPFVGVVQSSGITYTGGTGIVINAIQGAYRGEFWNVGSGFTTANQSVVGSGQLIGPLRYIGKSDERA